ncbi:MAG TPA: SDR family NAD(P)-dependent oxidoreductase, partial [Candidatus Polarisedimenticolia bacterium]|nr:SDR family NAD(P)-dependent oxidoreductase [Candidatus Polarisedimenticolia bacterium]
MDLGVKGKVALVTGSSIGIGRAIALALGREGCQVVINGRRARELDAVAAELRGEHAAVHAVVADVVKPQGAQRAVDETVRHFGAIHILVNNVGGIGRFASFADL